MKLSLYSLTASLLLVPAFAAAQQTITLNVTGGKDDLNNAIVVAPISAKFVGDAKSATVTTADGKPLLAQIAPARLVAADSATPELHVLIPELKAGQKLPLTVKFGAHRTKETFAWGEVEGLEQLSFNDVPVLRYFHMPFDPKATPPKAPTGNPTTKPYHHLFAPDGKTIVTNSNQGQYPHHRGIYYGFNKVSYGDKKVDVWHCPKGEHTSHEKVLAAEAGPLFGRQTLQIAWNGQDGQSFANEKRELTVYNVPTGKLIEFDSVLTTPLDKVRLDGDPQHAGFHFRANSAMEKNPKETFFIRPNGKGKPGEEKSWEPKGMTGPVNLPWDAMSFVLDGKRYTVVYLDHPDNPKEARQSERCYGRIGTYFEYELTKDNPLKVKYRLLFQEGEPTGEQCANLSEAFVAPPTVTVSEPK